MGTISTLIGLKGVMYDLKTHLSGLNMHVELTLTHLRHFIYFEKSARENFQLAVKCFSDDVTLFQLAVKRFRFAVKFPEKPLAVK